MRQKIKRLLLLLLLLFDQNQYRMTNKSLRNVRAMRATLAHAVYTFTILPVYFIIQTSFTYTARHIRQPYAQCYNI